MFVSNDMLTFTEILRPVGIILADIHAGDFNAARLGDEIAGLATTGRIVIAATNATFLPTPAGTLAKLAVGNLNAAGTTDPWG
ncbi:MAG: hypothetical protein MZV65_00290 [Chromatiales bacterium]|nr:hypothetical protein [Chromatiales bacterium]